MKYIGLIALLLLASCNNCRNNDCANDAPFQFKIENQDGKNLLITPNQQYYHSQIQIIGIKEDGQVQLNKAFYDYFEIALSIDFTHIVLKYEDESDTLEITNMILVTTDCCGPIVDNYDVKLDGELLCESCATSIVTMIK